MAAKGEDNISLEITRVINAPRERVYAAWTDPAQLHEWRGPEDTRTRSFTADVRVGGKFRWEFTTPEGEDWCAFGEYRELVPGKKVVFTWKWDDDETWKTHLSIVTVEFFDADGGTELRFRHEQLPSKESRDRHHGGWSSMLNRLTNFWRSSRLDDSPELRATSFRCKQPMQTPAHFHRVDFHARDA